MENIDLMSEMEALYNEGRFEELEVQARAMVERQPDSGFGWSVLGAALQMQGKEALTAIQKVAELLPDDAIAHRNLGSAFLDMGQFDKAITSFSHALTIDPDFAEAHNNLGVAFKQMNRVDEAISCFQRALKVSPGFAEASFNLGLAFKEDGRFEEAESSYRRALEINPNFAEAHTDLGNTLKELGQLEEALSCYRLALKIQPDLTEAHNNLGTVLQDLKRFDEAEAIFRDALKTDPGSIESHYNLGLTLIKNGQNSGAENSFREAVRIDPKFAKALNELGSLYFSINRFQDAEEAFRSAIKAQPDLQESYDHLLFQLSHSEEVDPNALFEEHLNFARHFETPLQSTWPQHSNSRDPNRLLRVGFVSGDFRNHALASFIEPILKHLSTHAGLSLYAYYTHITEDLVTKRIQGYMAHWAACRHIPDDKLAQKIAADEIDILIDLSGHTFLNRLLTFARKPAPLQVSWMGYAGTTGLTAMDYYVTDRHFLPLGKFDNQFSEKLVRLPASAPFLPLDNAPEVNALPALQNGYVTFGSFNGWRKLSPSVIALWSELLRALPSARMVIGGLPEVGTEAINELLREWFAKEGIPPERLSFYSRCPMQDYLALHQRVDICLDTFPYPGATTSCHGLWMGVPTLTLAGHIPVSRVGACLLAHVELQEFVADSKTEFVQKGLYWSSNLEELARLRRELRNRFERSPVGKPELIANAFADALRTMWRRWCARLPAESFEVLGPQNQTSA